MSAMTTNQFFDELNKLFSADDGYVKHLKRIIDLKHLKEDMEENWLSEEDVSAQVDPLYEEIKNVKKNAMKQVHKLNKQNKELKQKCEYWKECYELQQKETDIEHQRYLQHLEKSSELKEQNTYLEHEVSRYSNAVEEEYVLKEFVDELQEKITCLESDSMNEVSQEQFDEMVEDKDEEIKELKQKLTHQKGAYDFLKAVSIDKTMNTNSTDDIIKLEQENKELKLKLEASREVSTCYAKVISQSPERKVEEALKKLVISPESASYVASMIP